MYNTSHPVHRIPEFKPASKLIWWQELLKFLGLFVFFFTVLALIVMGPTIYTSLSYSIGGSKIFSSQFSLPSEIGDSRSDIESVISLVDKEEVPPVDTIIIPKINVNAPLVYIKDESNNAILQAIQNGVGHYPGTALPGRNGNAFFTGHSSYYWWSEGKYNQVFALLHNLEAGDLIYIYYQGEKYIYRATNKVVVLPTDVHVLDPTPTPTLSLMTCTPIGTNLKRLIVHADLISSPPVSGSDFDNIQSIPKLPTVLPLY